MGSIYSWIILWLQSILCYFLVPMCLHAIRQRSERDRCVVVCVPLLVCVCCTGRNREKKNTHTHTALAVLCLCWLAGCFILLSHTHTHRWAAAAAAATVTAGCTGRPQQKHCVVLCHVDATHYMHANLLLLGNKSNVIFVCLEIPLRKFPISTFIDKYSNNDFACSPLVPSLSLSLYLSVCLSPIWDFLQTT